MNVQVLLINVHPQRNRLNVTDRTEAEIARELNRLFDYTLHRAMALHLTTSVRSLRARWAHCLDLYGTRPVDIVIYAVPSTSHSVVSSVGNQLQPSTNEAGFTNFQSAPMGITGAEIYTSPRFPANSGSNSPSAPFWPAQMMAAIAYHECMHYKGHLNDNALHTLTGGRLAQARPPGGVNPSDADVTTLVQALANQWQPYLGGCESYKNILRREGAAARDLQDL
jgi:hypothetical protein